jgi:glycosidase
VGDSHFDGLMNYPVRTLILDLLNQKITFDNFTNHLNLHLHQYPAENRNAMYNLLGSHDTERILTMVGGNVQKMKLAYFLLMMLPGAPAVYYGDEVGITGGKDPECRKAFLWDETVWNNDLRLWIKALIHIRKNLVTVRRGEIKFDAAQQPGNWITWKRQYEDLESLVAVNPSPESKMAILPVTRDGIYRDMISLQEFNSEALMIKLELKPWSGCVIIPKTS